jgi:5-(carboxyamino)imidazole ribonucleotide synthase
MLIQFILVSTYLRVVKKFYSSPFRLGMLGGGQLGRMLLAEAIHYDVRIHCMDPSAEAPCSHLVHGFTQGSLNDFDAVMRFGKGLDVLTIEIENVNVDALKQLASEGVKVYPPPAFLEMVKDKGLQKQFYKDNGIPTAPFTLVKDKAELTTKFDQPFVQKMRTGGYDGKGVQVLRSTADLDKAFDCPSVIEELVPFVKEIAILVARNASGQMVTFPLVEMEFNPEANLVEFLFSPANVTESVAKQAQSIAQQIVESSQFVGLLAVELFVLADGSVLVNEMAPRPHNSGHHTIEANITSQYEQHLRAILDLPLGNTDALCPAVMINLLGEKGHQGPVYYEGIEEMMEQRGVYVHLYGKAETRDFRKMGHVTCISEDLEHAKALARQAMSTIKVKASV